MTIMAKTKAVRRTASVQVKVTPEEKLQIEKVAKFLNFENVSALVRKLTLDLAVKNKV